MAKERVALLVDVWNRHDFLIAEADQPLAQALFGFRLRQTRRWLARRRQPRRKLIETMDACDLFDEVDFALDVRAPGRLRALPRCEERAGRAALRVHTNRRESERAENRFDFLVGYVRAHHPKQLGAPERDFFRSALAGVDVNHAGEQLARRKLENQLGAAARGDFGHFGVRAAAEAC